MYKEVQLGKTLNALVTDHFSNISVVFGNRTWGHIQILWDIKN